MHVHANFELYIFIQCYYNRQYLCYSEANKTFMNRYSELNMKKVKILMR
jgi:hypothetical protein